MNNINEKTESVRHAVASVKDTTTSTIQHGKETAEKLAAGTMQKTSDATNFLYAFYKTHVAESMYFIGKGTVF